MFKVVARVTYDAIVESDEGICSICKNNCSEQCTECSGTSNICTSVMGNCGHVFHAHCISQWFINANVDTCPMCAKKFEQVESTAKTTFSNTQSSII